MAQNPVSQYLGFTALYNSTAPQMSQSAQLAATLPPPQLDRAYKELSNGTGMKAKGQILMK